MCESLKLIALVSGEKWAQISLGKWGEIAVGKWGKIAVGKWSQTKKNESCVYNAHINLHFVIISKNNSDNTAKSSVQFRHQPVNKRVQFLENLLCLPAFRAVYVGPVSVNTYFASCDISVGSAVISMKLDSWCVCALLAEKGFGVRGQRVHCNRIVK